MEELVHRVQVGGQASASGRTREPGNATRHFGGGMLVVGARTAGLFSSHSGIFGLLKDSQVCLTEPRLVSVLQGSSVSHTESVFLCVLVGGTVASP